MICGTCGSTRAKYFTWLGVTSIRCPDCGSDVMPEFNEKLVREQFGENEEFDRQLDKQEATNEQD